MTDIIDRLRELADVFEAQQAPGNLVLHLRAGADEIERKKAEIASLLNALADARTESMRLRAHLCAANSDLTNALTDRTHDLNQIEQNTEYIKRLRAALREILGWHDYSNDMHKPIEVRAAYMRARAALEGK